MEVTTTSADVQAIESFVRLLGNPITELRCLGNGPTFSGLFTDPVALANDACIHNEHGHDCYVSLNPVLESRFNDAVQQNICIQAGAGDGVAKNHIESRRWLLIDIDPKRSVRGCSTDAEKNASVELAVVVYQYLVHDMQWPQPIVCDSGNGAHLLFRIELPNDTASTRLSKQVLSQLAERFNNGTAKVDTSVYDANRISRLIGTVNRKEASPDRPQRVSTVKSIPRRIDVVTEEMLRAVAGELPKLSLETTGSSNGSTGAGWDVTQILEQLELSVANYQDDYEIESGEMCRCWVLRQCPWIQGQERADSHDGAFCLIQFPSGAVAATCRGERCTDRNWTDFRRTAAAIATEKGLHDLAGRLNPDPVTVTIGGREIKLNGERQPAATNPAEPSRGVKTVWMNEIERQPITWIWPGWMTCLASIGLLLG